MQSSEQNPTESPINQIVSENEIKTNVKETGQTQYYMVDIQKDKISQMPESSVPQSIKNVPPCSCAIQQMTNKDISPSVSKEDIFWEEEGLCPGKKYRPNELGAYSCKTYPGDKFCRHNPFMKEIIKIDRRKIEKRKEEEEKMEEKTEFIEAIQKETQISKEDITEKKRDKFIPDPDYPAYDDPWNILRTAPSTKIIKTDYEATLKLTPPAWFTTSSPLRTQERQNNSFSSKEEEKIKNLDKKNNNKNFLKSSNKFQNEMSKEKKEIKNIKKKKKESISVKKVITNKTNKKDTKLSSTISESTISKMEKKQTKSSLSNNPIKQSNKINKQTKHKSMKKNRKKNTIGETKEIENRKREMARLKNISKSFAENLGDIQPVVLPEELAGINQRNPEKKTEEIIDSSATNDEDERYRTKKGPYGWRTKSEQELPAKKTLVYLCEPDYPLETMTVRPGGRPCQCRENRNKKKILMYNIAGLVEKKRDGRRTRLEEENRIIDGVLYFTPPISPRRSNEYIPEYDLLESPYDMCVSEATDKRLKLIEKYSGPKSLVGKIQKKPKLCGCNRVTEENLADQKKDIQEARKKLMESKSPEERWKIALKDAALTDYFTQDDDNAPCWTSCKRIARNAKLVKKD